MTTPEIRVRTWVRGSEDDERQGLLGYLSLCYGSLILDGICLRRTAEGRFALSWPARTTRAGRRHPYARPISDSARKAIEHEIVGQLAEHLGSAACREVDDA